MNQNLDDIAKLAGVSRSTVSRVINQHRSVSERTRQKVMKVIEEQHYHPNLAARALVTQSTRILSIVIPQALAYTFADPYFPNLLQGINDKASENDYAVMLWIGSNAEEEGRLAERILRNSLFDGAILASAINGDPLLPQFLQARFPFVLIGPPQTENMNFVDVDNERGAVMAVSHLIRLGWKRIGTIAGPLNMGAARSRLRGYQQALERAGRAVDSALTVEGDFTENGAYRCMNILLQRRVDAVFVASDMMALGALRAIAEHGLRVPEDIGIASFDDLPLAATTTPPLTSVHQPIRELGTRAAQGLIDLLNGTVKQPYQVMLPTQLVVRESCGAAHL